MMTIAKALANASWPRERAEIVERFSGMWFSKNFYLDDGDIQARKTKGFGAYAMTKMRAELKMRAETNDA